MQNYEVKSEFKVGDILKLSEEGIRCLNDFSLGGPQSLRKRRFIVTGNKRDGLPIVSRIDGRWGSRKGKRGGLSYATRFLEKVLINVTLKIREMEFEGTIERITGHAADERVPDHSKDEIHVRLSFPGFQPLSLTEFEITIPRMEYSREELIEQIVSESNNELERLIEKADADRAYDEAQKQHQTEINNLVCRLINEIQVREG